MIANETVIQPNSEQGRTLIKDVHQLVESYPKVPITVDCVIFGFDNNELKVLLIRSDIEMYKGKWSLLGDFAHDDEELDELADALPLEQRSSRGRSVGGQVSGGSRRGFVHRHASHCSRRPGRVTSGNLPLTTKPRRV